ncbi:hypothetical protein SLE2022_055280 [Rubroshorea leprosula]
MTIVEAGMVQQRRGAAAVRHVNRVRYVNTNGISKKKKKRCRVGRRRPVLQDLFLSCREVFKGPGTVPQPSEVMKLCQILDKMRPEDLGLSSDLQFFQTTDKVQGNPRVTYTTIYQCNEFSLCIFFLPATAVIPLHNHPGMTVFSKLLLGQMHIKSYDWVDPANSEESVPASHLRLARLEANSVFKAPCDTSVLYPTTGGNIHQFRAITPCAVLDVLGPPYSHDRDCSYYRDFLYSAFSNGETTGVTEEERESYAWLEEIEMPENPPMDRIEYLGPQITDTGF